MEKKKKYQQTVSGAEMGTFTPLVFGTNRDRRVESQLFLKNLANKLILKSGGEYASTVTRLRTRLSFEIVRSTNMCERIKNPI